jgi:serine/threonine protein kinase
MSGWMAGDRVHGHLLQARIGSGGEGEVWRAEFLGEVVALKLFRGDRRPAERRRELAAAYALGRLEGPDGRCFPRIEQVDLEAVPAYVRMEYVDALPLEERVRLGNLTASERVVLALRILEALAVVHRHDFVHGDLSPRNILVTRDLAVRLIDVGCVASRGEAGDIAVSGPAPAPGPGLAAPHYAAPERFEPEMGPMGKAADVFSYGKVLYRLLTGESPQVIKPPSLRARSLTPAWDDFLFKCLEERPENRPPDAPAALAMLRRLLESAAPVRPVDPVVRAMPPADRDSLVPAAFVTALGYVLLWVPGAILNVAYLRRARRIARESGSFPAGTGALRAMQAVFCWLPLGIAAAGLGFVASLWWILARAH